MKRKILAFLLAVVLAAGVTATGTCAEAAGTKLLALTFDDGPGPYTGRLLDGLKAKGVKATFFTLGQRAEIYPNEIRRIVAEGHQLCNHSYNHPELTSLSLSGALYEIHSTTDILNRVTGGDESYFLRAPYGSMSSTLRSRLSSPEIVWSVDTLDWQYRDSGYVTNKLLNSVYDGAVVLMHDIHATTVTGVLNALDSLKSMGYEFVTVRELFRRRGVAMYGGQAYYECKPNGKDLGKAAKPELSLEAGENGVKVTLTTASAGARIYYTLDGSAIDCRSKVYTGPFTVTSPCTIRAAAAYHVNGGRGEELTYSYTFPPARQAEVSVEEGRLLFSAGKGEDVFYTLDGSDPKQGGRRWQGTVPIEPGTSIAFYTGGAEKLPTAVSRVFYSERGNLFADVSPSAWYFEPMDSAVSRGLLSGVGKNRFEPGQGLTRGMAVTILHRMSGEEAPEERQNVFTDVRDGAYYAAAVEWAYQRGIASGVSESLFRPDRVVTRQELAQFAVRYYEMQHGPAELSPEEPDIPQPYADWAKVEDWAKPGVGKATLLGLMKGSNKGNFNPGAAASRAEGAAVFCRLLPQEP